MQDCTTRDEYSRLLLHCILHWVPGRSQGFWILHILVDLLGLDSLHVALYDCWIAHNFANDFPAGHLLDQLTACTSA